MVACILEYPMGGAGFTCRALLPALPREGNWIDFGEDWPVSAPQRGASFQVRRVCFSVEGPCDQNPQPPRVIIKP